MGDKLLRCCCGTLLRIGLFVVVLLALLACGRPDEYREFSSVSPMYCTYYFVLDQSLIYAHIGDSYGGPVGSFVEGDVCQDIVLQNAIQEGLNYD